MIKLATMRKGRAPHEGCDRFLPKKGNIMARFTVMLSAVGLMALLAGCSGQQGVGGTSGLTAGGEDALVAQYDKLSEAILKETNKNGTEAQRKEELGIVRSLLTIYQGKANAALTAAKTAQGKDQVKPLQDGIQAVTDIAQEGDKRVNDIKLKLQKGGHHHTKAEGSDEEFIFVNPAQKKALMADAQKLREMLAGAETGKTAPAADIDAVQKDVNDNTDQALKSK